MDSSREHEEVTYLNCFAVPIPSFFGDYFSSAEDNSYLFDCGPRLRRPLINNPQHEHDDEVYFNILLMYNKFPRGVSSNYITLKNVSSKRHLQPHTFTDNILRFTNYILSHARNIVLPEAALADVEAKILACAKTIVEEHDGRNNYDGVFLMAVRVKYEIGGYMHDGNNDDVYRSVLEESLLNVDERHGRVPASESSIQELKSVKIQQQEEVGCTICMEDFKVGCEAVSMPCSHLFHRDCIITWLNNSNFCPICRFKMPTRDI